MFKAERCKNKGNDEGFIKKKFSVLFKCRKFCDTTYFFAQHFKFNYVFKLVMCFTFGFNSSS
jgi:hypothetical protein